MATDSSVPPSHSHDVRVALTAQPWRNARPGAGFTLTCRLRNETEHDIAGALLRFMLPLEVVVGADEPAVLALAGLAPHTDLTIEREIHLHPSTNDGTELRFEAVLNLPDGRLRRSNVAAIAAHNRAELSGSGTFVEIRHADAPREIVVSAHVSNHGTAPAHGIRLDLPLPAGTVRTGTSEPTTFVLDRLDAGESRVVAYRAHVGVTTARCVRVTGANVVDGSGSRIALAHSHPLSLRATLTAPSVTATRSARRVHVTLRGSNVDAGSARDVEFHVGWPAGFRCNPHSMTYNAARVIASDRREAFARADVGLEGATVTVAAIDAGESYELGFDLDASPRAESGTIIVDVGTRDAMHHGQATLTWLPRTDIRMRVESDPDDVDGHSGRVAIDIFNAGDNDVEITLHCRDADVRWTLDGGSAACMEPIALAAGERCSATVDVELPVRQGSTEDVALHIIARSQAEDVGHCRVVFPARGACAIAERRCGPEPEKVVTFFLKVERTQLATWLRLLRPPTGPRGLASHVCALRALLPTGVRTDDDALSSALCSVRESFEGLLDQVALKARMPGFTPSPQDFDDARIRHAMRALLSAMDDPPALARPAEMPGAKAASREAPGAGTLRSGNTAESQRAEAPCAEPAGVDDPHGDGLWFEVTLDRSWARQLLRRMDQSGPGSSGAWSCALAIVPRSAAGLDALSLSLERYVASLHPVLHDPARLNVEAERAADDARGRFIHELADAAQRIAR